MDRNPAVTLRPAEPRDRETLRAALIDLHNYENALSDTHLPGAGTVDAYLAWMLEHARARQGAIVVAQAGEEFSGFLSCWVEAEDNPQQAPDSNRYGFIADVYVAPAMRGRSVAQMLLDAAQDHLKAQAVSRLRISALANNASALAAYRKGGFAPYEVALEKRV